MQARNNNNSKVTLGSDKGVGQPKGEKAQKNKSTRPIAAKNGLARRRQESNMDDYFILESISCMAK